MRKSTTILIVILLFIGVTIFTGTGSLFALEHNDTRLLNKFTTQATPQDTDLPASYDTHPKIVGGIEALQNNIVYPEQAKQKEIEGKVILQVHINEKGEVIETKIVKGIPKGGLNEAAINAVKKTRFEPARLQQKPVSVWITLPILFKLSNEPDTGSLLRLHILNNQRLPWTAFP